MTRLHIASMGLTATVLLAAASVATATYSHALTTDSAARTESVCAINHSGQPMSPTAATAPTAAKASSSGARLTAQAPFATVCYTFAGPTCPMSNLVPPGTACVCYFPGLALAGIAY